MKNRHTIGILVILYSFACTATIASQSTLKNDPKAPPGDCTACHGSQKVLPAGHDSTLEMTSRQCDECHVGPGMSLRGRMSLGHRHNLAGVACDDCHGKNLPRQMVLSGTCAGCHGHIKKLIEKTARLDPNPHHSPHHGEDLECDLCHHLHKASEDACKGCHDWNMTVP